MMIEMTFSNSDLHLVLTVAFASLIGFLLQSIRTTQKRSEHLHFAIMASEDFYDRAEILLKDPAMPEALRDVIYDIALAVTDERAGKKVMYLLIKFVAEEKHKGRVSQPKKEYLELLDELRRTRGDLYDTFHEALSASFAAIVFAHAPLMHRAELALGYNTSGINRFRQLSFATVIDSVISGWRGRDGDSSQTATA
jgi:hypothetical protein